MHQKFPVALDADELRAVICAIGEVLDNPATFIGSPVREPEHLVRGYLTLVRARKIEDGWRPESVTLAAWAIEALVDATAPPKPAKEPRMSKASAAARKRMSDAARRRHARARRVATAEAPPADDDAVDAVDDRGEAVPS